MDGNADWWRRVLLGTIAAVVCAALAGGIYFWYVFPSSTNSFDNNLNGVAPAPIPVTYSTSTLQASQRALQQSAQGSASTTSAPAVLQASQTALEKAVQNNKAASGGAAQNNSASSDSSAAQQTELKASQAALEKAVQQSKGQ
jgi:hypothetical protein